MATQECVISCLPHRFLGAACYGYGHLFAPVRHDPVSRDARHLEKSAPPRSVLAGLHASPVPRAQNLGRTRPLDTGLDHGLALAPRPQGGLLEYPSTARVVGSGRLQYLATAQGRQTLSWRGWECETHARHPETHGPKGADKRASAVVLGGAVCAGARHVGWRSLPRSLSPDSTQIPSGV